jgi:acyl carrier protein
MTKSLYEIISKVMGVSIDQINDQSSPETIEKWSSFNALVLVDQLETEYEIKFTLDEITDVRNVSDIKKYLKNHGVNLDE